MVPVSAEVVRHGRDVGDRAAITCSGEVLLVLLLLLMLVPLALVLLLVLWLRWWLVRFRGARHWGRSGRIGVPG